MKLRELGLGLWISKVPGSFFDGKMGLICEAYDTVKTHENLYIKYDETHCFPVSPDRACMLYKLTTWRIRK